MVEYQKKTNVGRLIGRALLWAVLIGIGVSAFLYGLAYFFGDTKNSYLISYYWGPITAALMLAAILVFQIPAAMKLSKGNFFLYLFVTVLPVFALGALFLWWFFETAS